MAVERKTTAAAFWAILLVAGLISMLPFAWIIIGSFKPHLEIQKGRIWPWQSYEVQRAPATPAAEPVRQTQRLTLDNYKAIFM